MRPSTQAFRGMSRLQIRAIAVHTFVVVFSWEKCWFIFFLIIWILTWQFWRKQTAEVLFLSFFIDTFYIPWFGCTAKPPILPLSGLAKKRQHWKNGGKGNLPRKDIFGPRKLAGVLGGGCKRRGGIGGIDCNTLFIIPLHGRFD